MMGAKLFALPSHEQSGMAASPSQILIAQAGEPVTTEDGKVICYVKNHLSRCSPVSADDFHRFVDGEEPWMPGKSVDRRCIRANPSGPGRRFVSMASGARD